MPISDGLLKGGTVGASDIATQRVFGGPALQTPGG
jgi:hypothetical protein